MVVLRCSPRNVWISFWYVYMYILEYDVWYLFLATSSKLFSSRVCVCVCLSLSSFVSFFILKRIRQKVFKFFTKRETRAKTRPPHTIRISFDGDPPVPAEARSGARFVFSLLSRIFFSLSLSSDSVCVLDRSIAHIIIIIIIIESPIARALLQ